MELTDRIQESCQHLKVVTDCKYHIYHIVREKDCLDEYGNQRLIKFLSTKQWQWHIVALIYFKANCSDNEKFSFVLFLVSVLFFLFLETAYWGHNTCISNDSYGTRLAFGLCIE